MRIFLINSEYPPVGGGAGNASENLARSLANMGQEVIVLTAHFRGLPWRETAPGVKIYRAPARRKRIDRSLAYEQISFVIGGGLWAIPLALAHKPDVTLAFFGMPSGGIALLLKWLAGVPYVVSLRGGDVPGFRPYDFAIYHRMISPFLRVIWRQAGAVIANSAGLRSLAQAFDRRTPIQIIPNGVDPLAFTPAARAWHPPRLLFVGRVVYQKGLDLLLHALSTLRDLPWDLTIVGDGPQRQPLEKLAEQLEIRNRLRFVGWKKNHELAAEYQQANLFLYPSRHEGMPNAVLEAMASGLPVIASDIAGNEELIVHGETGLLIEPENQHAIEKALLSLLPNPALREQMGSAARQRAADCYPWERTAERYLHALQKVVHPPP